MKNITKSTLIAGFALLFGSQVVAQDKISGAYRCGTSLYMEKMFQLDPSYKERLEKMNEQWLKEQDVLDAAKAVNPQKNFNTTGTPIYTIPVVFHILHTNGPENISDAQVKSAIKTMNDDFQKLNNDNVNTISQFTGISADCQIQFKLAEKDPNGNCTKGINRVYSTLTNDGTYLVKSVVQWNPSRYLNIWVVNAITDPAGAAGYAQFPGGSPSLDGIVILHSYVGTTGTSYGTETVSNNGVRHALPHEVGHYLNLYHCWGGGAIKTSCGTDYVSDTPTTQGHDDCTNLSANNCGAGVENVQNIMEYSYCSTMFTAGQKSRMHSAIVNYRSTLVSGSNLTVTGTDGSPSQLCAADFDITNGKDTICPGASTSFLDMSWNAVPTGYNWTFTGGTPSSSTVASPSITYSTPGLYDVSYTATSGATSKSVTKNGAILVGPNPTNFILSESYETTAFPGSDWAVANWNSGSVTWTKTATAAATGSNSLYINNYSNATTGQIDFIQGPAFKFVEVSGLSVKFKYAYAMKAAGNTDKLEFMVSDDCGETWYTRWQASGSSLASGSGSTVASAFTPSAAQWKQITVTMSSFATKSNVRIGWKFTSGGGNNVYIDDLNITGTVTTGMFDKVEESSLDFRVYPNPMESISTIAFNLVEKRDVSVDVYDVLGNKVLGFNNGELEPGEYKYSINKGILTQGVYFITLNTGAKTFSQKLIVQ